MNLAEVVQTSLGPEALRQTGKADTAGSAPPRPIPDFYWLLPGILSAGEYPGAKADAEIRRKARRFLDAEINCFLDLTEAGELVPYAPILQAEAAARGQRMEHLRLPVRDLSTPSVAQVRQMLDTLDAKLRAGRSVYVHCWGGIGRTGTLIGCFLVRHGLTGDDALATIARLRQGTPDAYKASPETAAQRARVQSWRTGD
jgi:hypothetical protein